MPDSARVCVLVIGRVGASALTLACLSACPGDDTSAASTSTADDSTGDGSSATTTADASSSGSAGGESSSGAGPTTHSATDSSADSTHATTSTDPTASTDTTDTTSGSACGNGTVDEGEACDGDDLAGNDCVALDFDAGALACTEQCTYDTRGCVSFSCGNDAIEGKELCDGTDLGAVDCISEGFPLGGALACAADCSAYDTSGCIVSICGNDAIEDVEICDGAQLVGEDCLTQGFIAGALACAADCSGYDTSACIPSCVEQDLGSAVGPAVASGDTTMDDDDLAGSCGGASGNDRILSFTAPEAGTFAFVVTGADYDPTLSLYGDCLSGEIACSDDAPGMGSNASLTLDMTQGQSVLLVVDGADGAAGNWVLDVWHPVCGNGLIDFGETCDGAPIVGTTCQSMGFYGGTLGCSVACDAFDISTCANMVTTEFCATPNLAIPDNATVMTDIVVDGLVGVAFDLDVSIVATHSFLSDLTMTVTHVDTQAESMLFQHECFGNHDIDARLNQADIPFHCNPNPPGIQGLMAPTDGGDIDALVATTDTGNGTWRLTVTDDATQDVGNVSQWCLYISNLLFVGEPVP